MTKHKANILVTALILACIASIVFSLEKFAVNQSPTLEQMLPTKYVAQIDAYRDIFGAESEPVIVAITSPASMERGRVATIEAALQQVPGVAGTLSMAAVEPVSFGRGEFFVRDGNTELMLILLSQQEQTLEVARTLSANIESTINEHVRADESVAIVGQPQIRAASWQVGRNDAAVMLPLLVVVTLVVTLLFFRSYAALALSLLLTSLTTSLCLALLLLIENELSVLFFLVVPVIWAVSTLDAFHLYSRAVIKAKQNHPSPVKAARAELIVPSLLTSITTAACFLTLALVDSSPLIVVFAVWASVGVALAFVLTFTVGEKILSMHDFRDRSFRWPSVVSLVCVKFGQRHPIFTVLCWAMLTGVSVWLITTLQVANNVPQVFASNTPVAREVAHLQELFDSDLSAIDIYVEADDANGQTLENLASAALLTNHYLSTIAETRLVLPMGMVAEEDRQSMLMRWQTRIRNGQEGKSVSAIEEVGSWFNEDRHVVRLQLYLKKSAYSRKREIYDWITHFDETMLSQHKLTLSGPGYLYFVTERSGITSLLVGGVLSVVIICLVLLWITQKPLQTLIAILGCIVPATLLVGVMAALDIPWSIALLPMPAVLLGLMNDDTIHIVWRSRKRQREGFSHFRRNAIAAGPALLATTLILSGAVATLLLSGFQTNQYLGLLIPIGLLIAFLCNLTLLPALNSLLHRSAQSKR